MTERVNYLLNDFNKALNNLKVAVESVQSSFDEAIAIDATIKRFELCYELSWKLIKAYLAYSGIIVNNPRDSFKMGFQNNLIDDESTWIQMIEDRNVLVHTYNFDRSREIFEHIKQSYINSFEYLLKTIKME